MGTTEAELRREAATQRARMGETLESIGDRLSPERMVERRKAAVGQGFKRLRESVMGSSEYEEPMSDRMRRRASGAAGSMTDTAQSAAHSMADTAQSAAQTVQRAPEMLKNQTRGNPMAAGIVAFGVGALFATLFPETQTEQRLVGAAQPQLQHAAEEAKGAGRELAQDAKQHGQEAAEQVRIAGTEAASTVADQAKGSAQQVAQDVRKS